VEQKLTYSLYCSSPKLNGTFINCGLVLFPYMLERRIITFMLGILYILILILILRKKNQKFIIG